MIQLFKPVVAPKVMMFSIQCNTIQYNKKAIVSWLSTPAKGMVKFEPVVASKNIYIYISA